ncbi:MAG: hypothetical protein ACYSTS_09240 [Planctomycetota bacterium]|jgi:hypothetical protein
MTVGNNRRNIPRNIKKKRKVFSGLHKPLTDRKLKLKMSGPYKNEKFTLAEIRKLVEDIK